MLSVNLPLGHTVLFCFPEQPKCSWYQNKQSKFSLCGYKLGELVLVQMAPYSLLHPLFSVCFEDKMKFSASHSLCHARRKLLTLAETEIQRLVWNIGPLTFSVKLFRSLTDPQRTDRSIHSNMAEQTIDKQETWNISTKGSYIYVPRRKTVQDSSPDTGLLMLFNLS